MSKGFVRRSITAGVFALALGLQACGEALTEPGVATPRSPLAAQALQGAAESTDILVALRSLPGVTVVEGPTRIPGTRFFILGFDQPVDHERPEGARFQHRVTLLHRSTQAPTVVFTTGYDITGRAGQTEVTSMLQGNQLTLEHRFFGASVPQPLAWEHLNLEQAAADQHRVIQALKTLYSGRFISTGFSKGGMTALFHRALYPDDVDATVAYVAPNSYGPKDPRYIQFLDRVGPAECREKLRAFQRDALERRDTLAPLWVRTGEQEGYTFDFLGADKSFEFTVLELPFSFWQYGTADDCARIPAPGAPDSEVVELLAYVVTFYPSDFDVFDFAPYYFQAATQLGSYRSDERHLAGRVRYPGAYTPASLVPFSLAPYRDDRAAMHQMKAWVRNEGERILLIYGENDPWSAGAFEVRERNDSLRFFVPGGNHTASLRQLPEPQRSIAMERLATWAGLAPQAAGRLAAPAPALDAPEDEDSLHARDRRSRRASLP